MKVYIVMIRSESVTHVACDEVIYDFLDANCHGVFSTEEKAKAFVLDILRRYDKVYASALGSFTGTYDELCQEDTITIHEEEVV